MIRGTMNLTTRICLGACLAVASINVTSVYAEGRPARVSVPRPTANASYSDVPRGHFAEKSVTNLKQQKILAGTGKFDGNKYVTRYEAAVLIDRFVHYIEHTRQPLVPKGKAAVATPSDGIAAVADLRKLAAVDPKGALLAKPATALIKQHEMADALAFAIASLPEVAKAK